MEGGYLLRNGTVTSELGLTLGACAAEVRVIHLRLASFGFRGTETGAGVIGLRFEPHIAQKEQGSADCHRRPFIHQNLCDLPGHGRAYNRALFWFQNKPATHGFAPHGREQGQSDRQGCSCSLVRRIPPRSETLLVYPNKNPS